jgi:hypothetical protein
MTGDHKNTFTLRNSKDVPQFAPNFTVYVLPPDVVCLYSRGPEVLSSRRVLLCARLRDGSNTFRPDEFGELAEKDL